MDKKDKQDKQPKHIQIPINTEKQRKLERKQRIKVIKEKKGAVTLEDIHELLVDINDRLDELENK